MKIERIEVASATITVTSQELLLMNNSLNEVCNGLAVDEFATRLGGSVDEARTLLADVGRLCDRLQSDSKT